MRSTVASLMERCIVRSSRCIISYIRNVFDTLTNLKSVSQLVLQRNNSAFVCHALRNALTGLRSMADHATTEDIENKLKEKLAASHLVCSFSSVLHTQAVRVARP